MGWEWEWGEGTQAKMWGGWHHLRREQAETMIAGSDGRRVPADQVPDIGRLDQNHIHGDSVLDL